jgi:formamidopyrimidine-DNA glycosylase
VPELPEVEVVRAGLEPAVVGAVVSAVSILDERALRRHSGPSDDFIERLTGRGILSAERRGKFIWLPLSPLVETPEALVLHLGMSGQVLVRDRESDDPLTRIRLDLTRGGERSRLNFVDQRIFGSMAIDSLVPAVDAPGDFTPTQVAHIARDPLDPLFDDRKFFERLHRKQTGVKRALLDQTLVSGIGNIYADESLWRAKMHYDQLSSSLPGARVKTLLEQVRIVLATSLADGGTSFDAQYVNVNGASGYFSQSLNVYGQQGKPCPRCGRTVVRESFMNRGSHFCPYCQRLR